MLTGARTGLQPLIARTQCTMFATGRTVNLHVISRLTGAPTLMLHVSVADLAGPEAGPLLGPRSPVSGGADLPIGGSRASGKDWTGDGEKQTRAGERGKEGGRWLRVYEEGCLVLALLGLCFCDRTGSGMEPTGAGERCDVVHAVQC